MSVFVVDSVVLAAAALKRDTHHKKASRILTKIGRGELGKCIFTDFIIAETLTLIRFSGRGGVEASSRAYEILLSSKNLGLTRLSDEELRMAGQIFKKYPAPSFVDATTVGLMQNREIKNLISFDTGFDAVPGVVRHEEI